MPPAPIRSTSAAGVRSPSRDVVVFATIIPSRWSSKQRSTRPS